MKHKKIYFSIFEKAKEILAREYSAGEIPDDSAFENAVFKAIEEAAKGKDVQATPLGKRAFPDIKLEHLSDGEKVGVEVKLHTAGEAWTTLGNSAYATTQEPNLVTIYLFFGNFEKKPVEFEIKPYGECIKDIKITHNPRYMIDMKSSRDFCVEEMGLSFDTLRAIDERDREIYVNTYIAKTKHKELSGLVNKQRVIAQGFVLFPEFFANNQRIRYQRMSVWLFAKNILCRNVRDFLSASGKQAIAVIGPEELPKIFSSLQNCTEEFKEELKNTPSIILKSSWSVCGTITTIPENLEGRIKLWLNLVARQYEKELISETPYKLRDTLEKLLK